MYYGAKKNGVEDLYYVMNDISYLCWISNYPQLFLETRKKWRKVSNLYETDILIPVYQYSTSK